MKGAKNKLLLILWWIIMRSFSTLNVGNEKKNQKEETVKWGNISA